MWFQNSCRPIIEYILFFHDVTFLLILVIALAVFLFFELIFFPIDPHRFLIDNQAIEFIWTLTPCIVLLILAIPSLQLLYLTDEASGVEQSFKAIGHQWYWSYEYGQEVLGDIYITESVYRLLDVDNRLKTEIIVPMSCYVTRTDVIHCWTIPVLGVKVDGVPGRLNQIFFSINRPGVFYGQCSEICGSNHRFIPICLERVV